MKLTNIALRWAKRLPKGDIYRGKNRLVKEVKPLHIAKKIEEYEVEEKNMFYLRNPYLTPEQEYGHTKPFNHGKRFIEKIADAKLKNWKSHKLLGDRFGFLKVNDSWE